MTQLDARRKLIYLDIDAMVTCAPDPVPWIVEGVVAKGCLTMLSGQPGRGKSLLTQAIALAAITPGGDCVARLRVEPARVVIVDAENGRREIHRRVNALGLRAGDAERLSIYEAEEFRLDRDMELLEELVARAKPDLLILDAFRSLWPIGDENKSEDVAPVLDALRNLVRRHDVGAILVHHAGKSGQTYRGSSAIGASVELAFILDRVDGDEDRQRRRLRCEKSRPAPDPSPTWLRLANTHELGDGQLPIQPAEAVSEPTRDRATVARSLAAEAVEAVQHRGPMRRADIARHVGREPSDGSVRRAVKRATHDGLLVPSEDGLYALASQNDNAD